MDDISWVSERFYSCFVAYHRQGYMSCYVLLYSGRVSLYKECEQIYESLICVFFNITFCLCICVYEFCRLEVDYSLLLWKCIKSNKCYVVTFMGTGLCILAFGTNRGKFKTQMLWMIFYVAIYATVHFFAIDKIYGLLQLAVVFAIPIIMMYNGQRGKNQRLNSMMKRLFYVYYPLHFFVIGWIQYVG